MNKVLVIVGPTAIGKSDLAIELAKSFHGEIINGDSVQVYKELCIGSAKVTDTQGIPHHLIDYKEVNEPYNVAEFQKDARNAISDVLSRNRLPIICGGTGLYIKALLYDYSFTHQDNLDEDEYNGLPNEELYNQLKKYDPQSCEKIHPNNRKRVIRALQICKNGLTKTEQENLQNHKMIYNAKIIGLTIEREKLRLRIDRRVDKMIQNGLIEEVKSLFEKYPLESHAFTAIGYKELISYYQRKQDLEKCIEEIKTHTKQFAKRQYTWFNHQMPVKWYDIEQSDYKNQIFEDVEDFLHG